MGLNNDWMQRDISVLWHPCTQMKDHEHMPVIPIQRGEGIWLHDFEGTPPQCATFLPGDLLRSAGLLAAQTVPMSFGSICFVLMQDPIMAISFLPLRILVLWVVAGGLAAFMLRQIGKQREQILAEFQKEVKTVSALNSIRRNLMRILKKRGRRCGGSSNNGGTAGGNPGGSKNEKTALLEV